MGQFMFTYPIKIGQVSRVFEDQHGYHVAKLIGGTLKPEVIKYDSLHYLYKNEQLYFLLERYLKLIKRYAYKVIYITNEYYDDSYMHRTEIESLIDYLYLLPK
ncbi:MAG TPA: hypothetical protein ACYCDB_00200 [Candidatus Azoamicus sp.]